MPYTITCAIPLVPSPERVCSCGVRTDAPKSVRPSPGCFSARHVPRPYSPRPDKPHPRPNAVMPHAQHPDKRCPHACHPDHAPKPWTEPLSCAHAPDGTTTSCPWPGCGRSHCVSLVRASLPRSRHIPTRPALFHDARPSFMSHTLHMDKALSAP